MNRTRIAFAASTEARTRIVSIVARLSESVREVAAQPHAAEDA